MVEQHALAREAVEAGRERRGIAGEPRDAARVLVGEAEEQVRTAHAGVFSTSPETRSRPAPGLQHISRMELSATGVANLDRNIGRLLDTLAMLGRLSNPPVLDRAISFTAAVARA